MKEIVVIGGGAAGLAAAIAAAEAGASVTVLERQQRVGKKILLTGNGRCNLGHAELSEACYHGSVQQAMPLLAEFDAAAYFRKMGLIVRSDAEGRLYPASGMAASVLDALRFSAEARGVKVFCERQVTKLQRTGARWQIECCGNGQFDLFFADAVIAAAGGSAAPNCGTDGNLLPVLREMGLKVVQPQPALCPIPTDRQLVTPMKGMRVKAQASAYCGTRLLKTETGEVQFTETALSGICIFNLSRLAAKYGTRMVISLNLLFEYSEKDAAALLQELIWQRSGLPLCDLLSGLVPKRVGECIIKVCLRDLHAPAMSVLNEPGAFDRLLRTLRDWRFPVTGTSGFDKAQVTAGGIAGESVTERLESWQHPGLYLCGELLDVDGDCGGYNLAWAWCSGICAGRAAAEA